MQLDESLEPIYADWLFNAIRSFSAMAADIEVGKDWATIECDATKRLIEVTSPVGSFINIGTKSVFLRIFTGTGNLARDNAERVGEIELKPNGTAPLRRGQTKIERQCLSGETTVIQWYPDIT